MDRTASQSSNPWPVSPRGLLTRRERELYDNINELYPSHRLFIQVALSQLINVDGDHPEWAATRNRIDRLVADFVLCLPDLSVVAVIELDDRSHQRADRQAADARKTKALADAGLRLIRIPEGPLPSADSLREIIGRPPGSDTESRFSAQSPSPAPHLCLVDDEAVIFSADPLAADDEWQTHKAMWRRALGMLLAAAFLIGGWYGFVQVTPRVLQAAFQPLAAQPQSRPPLGTPVTPKPTLSPVVTTIGPFKAELEAKRDDDLQAAEAMRKQKQVAWAAFFRPAASCDHPGEWKAQVECGNQYMRAKLAFEAEWSKTHGDASAGSGVVLDNQSLIRGVH